MDRKPAIKRRSIAVGMVKPGRFHRLSDVVVGARIRLWPGVVRRREVLITATTVLTRITATMLGVVFLTPSVFDHHASVLIDESRPTGMVGIKFHTVRQRLDQSPVDMVFGIVRILRETQLVVIGRAACGVFQRLAIRSEPQLHAKRFG